MKKGFMILTATAGLMLAMPLSAHAQKNQQAGPDGKGPRAMKMFETMDTDSDGVVTQAEFTAHAMERFAKMDADGDGSVTREEARAMHQEMKEKMKEKRGEWRKDRVGEPTGESPDTTGKVTE